MTGLFPRNALTRKRRVGPVILLGAVVALQLTPAPARAAGGTVSADNVSVHEPSVGTRAVLFTVTLARADADPVTVNYATLDGTATAGQDYVATSGSLDFGPAGVTRTVRVLVLGDALDEVDETFALRLSGASNGQTRLDATATITDVDAPPRLSIGNAQVREGTAGPGPDGPVVATFAVSLSDPSGQPVTVDYTTTNGSGAGGATAPSDFAATSGSLTFNPGERVKPVSVPVTADAVDEMAETFRVALANAAGATIGTGAGTGTIVDGDGPPALTVEDATAAEGAAHLTFRVAIDRPSSQNVTFQVQTADGTGPGGARADDDYTALTSTPAQIPAGETSVGIDVVLSNDQVHEAAETMSLVLSSEGNATLARPVAAGTITDDDPGLDLSVGDVTATEGTLVGDSLVFTVTLSPAAGSPVTVNYATANGTAVSEAPSPDRPDYAAAAGTLTFQPAQTTKTVTVFLNHDSLAEGTETLAFTLSNPSGGVALARPSAIGTIEDDDGAPDELRVSDIAFAEGHGGTAAHLFTVTRARRSGGARPSAGHRAVLHRRRLGSGRRRLHAPHRRPPLRRIGHDPDDLRVGPRRRRRRGRRDLLRHPLRPDQRRAGQGDGDGDDSRRRPPARDLRRAGDDRRGRLGRLPRRRRGGPLLAVEPAPDGRLVPGRRHRRAGRRQPRHAERDADLRAR